MVLPRPMSQLGTPHRPGRLDFFLGGGASFVALGGGCLVVWPFGVGVCCPLLRRLGCRWRCCGVGLGVWLGCAGLAAVVVCLTCVVLCSVGWGCVGVLVGGSVFLFVWLCVCLAGLTAWSAWQVYLSGPDWSGGVGMFLVTVLPGWFVCLA